jgi:hypothetical protein
MLQRSSSGAVKPVFVVSDCGEGREGRTWDRGFLNSFKSEHRLTLFIRTQIKGFSIC